MRRLAALICALTACGPASPVLLREDQVAVAVGLAEDDSIRWSAWVDGSTGLQLSVPTGDALVVVIFEREAFELRGAGSWRQQYPTITLGDGGCGARLMPRGGFPQLVLAGESCPIPESAEVAIHYPSGGETVDDTARLAAFRAAARLVWGERRCPRVGRIGPPNGIIGERFDAWLAGSGLPVRRVHESRDAAATPLDAALLDDFDLILLEWPVRTYTSTEAAAFAAWVRGGGGFVSTSGFARDSSEPARIDGLLAGLGVAYVGPVRDGPIAAFEPHPVTEGLSQIEFVGGYGVEAPPTATALARTPEGVVAVAAELGRGRAVMWGDEWILSNMLFEGGTDTQVFWAQAMMWAARRAP